MASIETSRSRGLQPLAVVMPKQLVPFVPLSQKDPNVADVPSRTVQAVLEAWKGISSVRGALRRGPITQLDEALTVVMRMPPGSLQEREAAASLRRLAERFLQEQPADRRTFAVRRLLAGLTPPPASVCAASARAKTRRRSGPRQAERCP